MFGVICLVCHVHFFRLHSLITFVILIIPLVLKPSVLFYHNECPDCFDNDFCNIFHNGDIQLSWTSKFFLILNPNITKSVFFGVLNGTDNVVLKSVTKRSELPVNYHSSEQALGFIASGITWNCSVSEIDSTPNVFVCPNLKSLDILLKNVDDDLETLRINRRMWLNINLSIEPLLLKLMGDLPDMPVPKYIGACGDIIVKEHKGISLSKYFHSDWMERAFLSVQLLKMAENFTFSHKSLIFYFTDFSPYNIVVDECGHTFLVDLDDVILAERAFNENDNGKILADVHTSVVMDPLKLAIIPEDVCKHSVSDHNYFAVCRYILVYSDEMGRGLLEDIPETTGKDYEVVQMMIDECSEPKKYGNRIVSGRLLTRVLEEILGGVEWKCRYEQCLRHGP